MATGATTDARAARIATGHEESLRRREPAVLVNFIDHSFK
jgi:hypothetical protein